MNVGLFRISIQWQSLRERGERGGGIPIFFFPENLFYSKLRLNFVNLTNFT